MTLGDANHTQADCHEQETADSDQLLGLLDESHALLRATEYFTNEPSTIHKIQHTSTFMSEHENISHLLQTSGLNVKSLRDYKKFNKRNLKRYVINSFTYHTQQNLTL